MKASSCCLTLLASILFVANMVAAKPPVVVSTRVDKQSITVGDEITYEISVTHPHDVLVKLPTNDEAFYPFEVKRHRPLPRRVREGQMTEGNLYFLTTFQLGKWKIPSLRILYTDYRERFLPGAAQETLRSLKEEEFKGSVATEPVDIEVKSILGEEAPPIVDIQRIKKPEKNLWSLFKKVGSIFFFVGVLCIGIYGVIRLLPKPVSGMSKVDPVAFSLRSLGEFKKKVDGETVSTTHYETLAKILREYLARQFDPLTLDLTTTELAQRMSRYPPCEVISEKVNHILTVSDLVKFASRRISQEEFHIFLNETERIILSVQSSKTTPVA